MSSPARDSFLQALAAFRTGAEEEAVVRGDPPGDFLRRGLTVAGFNLLETFIAQRLEEYATFLNAGQIQFLDLPDKLQRQSILNTVKVANWRLRRPDDDLVALRAFSERVGVTLSAVGTALQLSSMTWLWDGSNMAPAHYHDTLRRFHVASPWETAHDVATRIGFVQPDLKNALRNLTEERHLCAHEALHGVTALWLRSIPNRILMLAAAFDILGSTGCVHLRDSDSAFMGDDKWLTSKRVTMRFVKERSSGAAEVVEGKTRASRVAGDADLLFREAVTRARAGEAVIRYDVLGEVVTWEVSPIG